MFGRLGFIGIVALALFAHISQSTPSGASSATVTQACSAAKPGTATVTLAWPAPQAGAQQTWFDISLVPGFAPGWFQGHGPLAPAQTAYAMDGIPQGLAFYYRVNTLYPTGWKETASGSFISNCGGGVSGSPPSVIDVAQVCEGAGVTVKFKWNASAPGSQWLDLSTMNNGFVPGTFVGAGPVPSGTGQFVWGGIARGVTHYWRVNALTSAGWSTSNVGAFTSLSCEPPLKSCIGYMAGFSAAGRAECELLVSKGGDLGSCIAYILQLAGGDKGACVRVKENYQVVDCLLGLSGQSYFGGTSCRLYYGA